MICNKFKWPLLISRQEVIIQFCKREINSSNSLSNLQCIYFSGSFLTKTTRPINISSIRAFLNLTWFEWGSMVRDIEFKNIRRLHSTAIQYPDLFIFQILNVPSQHISLFNNHDSWHLTVLRSSILCL